MTEFEYVEEEIVIEYDSDGDEIIEIEVYETDSEASSYYEEEEIPDLPAVIEEEEEEKSESEAESEYYYTSEEEDEAPAWTKMALRKTDKGDTLRTSGNLAAPITFTPFKNNDFENKLVSPKALKLSAKGMLLKKGENLSMPITKLPDIVKKDHTNHVANPDKLRSTELGDLVKQGVNLASPITNIREANNKKKMKGKKLVTRKVKKKDLDQQQAEKVTPKLSEGMQKKDVVPNFVTAH